MSITFFGGLLCFLFLAFFLFGFGLDVVSVNHFPHLGFQIHLVLGHEVPADDTKKYSNIACKCALEGCGARSREIFRGFSALGFLKYLGKFLSALAISGHSERFSPSKIRFKVGHP